VHAVGLAHVDEIWAATDYIRDAIAKRAGDIPVRTVTPPLPQAGSDPGVVPERFGIPTDRPWFLFTFDFLSVAARKNPYGLVEAFTRAFGDLAVDERPALVIKTINASRCPDDAERLRFQIGGRTDVLFLDAYLDNHERHVLAANCTAYVSLHKAEGLGLTIAEAMAWSKPVITTAYGGVTQFCTPENSFLVDWERGYVDETVGPYLKGLAWAEPDLDQAAAYLRAIVDDPQRAAAVGAQAGRDIREKHNARVAGEHMREVLEQGDAEWRAKRAAERAARRAGRRQGREGSEAVVEPTVSERARRGLRKILGRG
jgi:glycosyltransferase involved in cell wall biosynthesis